ncbi:MAG: zinc ribbon domain-containing protein [Spirochaetales bacterium]
MLDNFLEYQKLDAQLLSLEKQVADNTNKKQANLMIMFIKDAQEKSKDLDDKAGKLIAELEKLKEVKDKGFNFVEKYSKQNLEGLSFDELKALESSVTAAINNLKEVEKRILVNSEKMNAMLTEFETTKKKVMLARQKHKEHKEVYDKLVADTEPQIKKIQTALKQKEKDLDKELFEKYKNLRKDGIFPIVVELKEGACSGCGMGLASNTLAKLDQKGYLQCEQCRRIIYSK